MDEEKLSKTSTPGPWLTASRMVMVVAALALVAAFFLPWASADSEFREAASKLPDVMFYEPTGMTATDATDLSLLEYAQVYSDMAESGPAWMVYAAIMYVTVGCSALALLLSALGKPIGAIIPTLATLVLSRLLVWDFGDRAVLPNSTHDWGIAPTIYLFAAVALIAAAVWMVVVGRQAKHKVAA